MFHLKDIRRRNVSSSPYLSSRALDASSTPNYDPINEHDIPAHDFHINNPNIATSHQDTEVEDVLAPGDIVGRGSFLKGHVVSLLPTDNDEDEDEQFQVIKELGKGSYAVVYLVQQVLRGASAPTSASSRARSNTADSEDSQIVGHMDSEEPLVHKPTKIYGRKFAIKCLSKANLDKEELAVQMAEVTIHQCLPVHPNIVALHKTLQTSSYLLLVLEYVPGEDLFYFLQQARDHYPSFPPESLSQDLLLQQQQTPPTPSLLSSCHPSHLLSRSRLRLIASMFAQMCDAVATCHAEGVFHRDIKPENFIVTDGRYLDEGTDRMNGGKDKGRVVVKLTDFGLSTREEECSDMDCGSAPYMSYECRNNIAPTYRPREADVWSLGIVLINMLYHINPWTDTAHGMCPSFTAFRQDPVGFFTRLFSGMTPDVARVLAWRVFGVDNELTRVSGKVKEKRMTAAELGVWVRSNLVDLLAMDETSGSGLGGGPLSGTSTARAVVNGGHRLSLQMRLSHLPVSRAASPLGRVFGSVGGVGGLGVGAVPSPRLLAMALSRAPSLAPAIEKEECETEIDGEMRLQIREEMEPEDRGEQEQVQQQEEESEQADATPSRTSTTTRRRRRGQRGKGVTPNVPAGIQSQLQDQQQQDEALRNLTDASQFLVREISNVSKPPSVYQLQLQLHHQPSSSSLTSVIGPNHVNGDALRMSLESTLSSSESGVSEISEDAMGSGSGGSSKTVLTTATSTSMMSMVTEAMAETTATNTTEPTVSVSLKSSANSTRTTSTGSLHTTTLGAGGGRSKARPRKPYEPVSMYPVQSALLRKHMGAGGGGGRTPSQLSSSSGARSVAGSVAGSVSGTQPREQPKAVVKRPSKWALWKNTTISGSVGGNNAASTSVTATRPIPATPATPSPNLTAPTPATATGVTPSASASSLVQVQACSAPRPIFSPIGLPGHVSAFPATPSFVSDASSAQGQSDPSRAKFNPIGAPGHIIAFPTSLRPGSVAEQPSVMSPTVTNVTNLIMGLNPASAQQQSHLNESNGSLAGASGNGSATSTTTWKRGRRGKGTADSMAILSGAAAEGGVGSSSYKPKSSSRSPGPAPSFSSGFGSSASSSSVSLVSGAGVDLGQGHDGGWHWRDKRSSDRIGTETRGMYIGSGVGGPGTSGGSRGVGVRSPLGASGYGAGGGRHGSVAAAWGPLASSPNSVFGPSRAWRANPSMIAMSSSMNASGSGGASLHGSMRSGTASPGASTIAFTRFSNSSVSTVATSISTGSRTANWRNGGRTGTAVAMNSSAVVDADGGLVGAAGMGTLGGKTNSYAGANLPNSVNIMDGISNVLPRSQQTNPDFGSPPVKKMRTRNKKGIQSTNNNILNYATNGAPTGTDTTPTIVIDDASNSKDLNLNKMLDTIIERPLAPDPSTNQQDGATAGDDGPSSRKEASTSTTDLVAAANANTSSPAANGVASAEGMGGTVGRVKKGQITTLAKMLSALRR